MRKFHLRGAASVAVMAFCGAAAQAADEPVKFEVAAELSSTYWYTDFQKPYFEETLPQASNGTMTANAVPFDQLGLTGFELMKLVKNGTIDIASITLNYVTQDSPALNGGSLAGITTDLDAFQEIYAAYRPIIERELQEKYNAKPLALFAWPQNQIFCNFRGEENVTFDTLKGKNIRSFAATVSDLIEGLGAVPVTIPFAEVVPALERGAIECQSSSMLGAYSQKIYKSLTHKIAANVSYSSSFIVINIDTWNKLSDAQKEALSSSMADLEASMRDRTASLEAEMQACLTDGPCPQGEVAGLKEVTLTADDVARMREVVENVVLKRYAERCDTQACIDDWNATVGKVVGLTAAK